MGEIVENVKPPLMQESFIQEMVRQLRALDSYGTYDDRSDERILMPLVLTKERKREIQAFGDPDEITVSRIQAFYNAIAVRIEQHSGYMAVPMLQLSHEGFGRLVITVGKLVVLDRTLRDVHRFGFASLEKLNEEGSKLITKAIAVVEEFRSVTGLTSSPP